MSQELKRCFATAIHNSFMTAGLLLHFEFNITPPPPLLSMLTVRDRVKTLQFSYSFCHHYLGERNKEQNNRFIGENLHQSYQD